AEQLSGRGLAPLLRATHQERISRAMRARGGRGRILSYLRFSLGHGPLLRRALALAAQSRPLLWAGFRRAYVLTRQMEGNALFRGEPADPRILLLDQDILQEVWSILYLRPAPSERRLEALIAELAPFLADVIVLVRVEPRTALERMRARQHRLGPVTEFDLDPSLDATRLRVGEREAARIGRLAARIGGGRLIELDGARPLEESLSILLEALERCGALAAASPPDPAQPDPARSDSAAPTRRHGSSLPAPRRPGGLDEAPLKGAGADE
ncbi:MAG: hypothetical protein OEY14_09545, partial [Myxococcales bacterium]|nr:hypothetical protein [Myxococcales bacterium]